MARKAKKAKKAPKAKSTPNVSFGAYDPDCIPSSQPSNSQLAAGVQRAESPKRRSFPEVIPDSQPFESSQYTEELDWSQFAEQTKQPSDLEDPEDDTDSQTTEPFDEQDLEQVKGLLSSREKERLKQGAHSSHQEEKLDLPQGPESLEGEDRLSPKSDDSEVSQADTVIITGGTKLTPRKYSLHENGLLCNGRLPSEDPRYEGLEDMEEESTQPLTQPRHDRRREGQSGSMSKDDEADVICILHPCSPAAYKVVELVAQSSPQHVLQNENMASNMNESTGSNEYQEPPTTEMAQGNGFDELTSQKQSQEQTTRKESYSLDIALRLSSRVQDICLGFVFGRNPMRCDIVIGTDGEKRRISNMHFRIYLNEAGVIMIEDISTNGTIVEEVLLRHNTNDQSVEYMRMLQQGSIIQLITSNPEEELKFIVSIPARDRGAQAYTRNVCEYLAFCAQRVRQVEAFAKAKLAGNLNDAPPPMSNPLTQAYSEDSQNRETSSRSLLSAGSERFHQGMHWNGAPAYSVVGMVGKGAFAIVYKLATRSKGEIFACKELDKHKFIKNGILSHKVNNELEIMKKLDHPHIVKYVDYHELPRYLYIVMEYVKEGDLLTYLNNNNNGYLTDFGSQNLARQMCHALAYLHKCGIAHRDIKPDNILIASRNPFVFKITDFGLSKVVKENETFLKTFCGTLLYCAPEVYPDYDRVKVGLPRKRRRNHEPPITSPYSSAVDIWSLAAVLFHALSGKPPWSGSGEDRGVNMLENILTNPVPWDRLSLGGTSNEAMDFLKSMLQVEPSDRPRAEALLNHVWIRETQDSVELGKELADIPQGLGPILEEGEELDASRLSLGEDNANANADVDVDDHDLEEDLSGFEEIGEMQKSKRFKADVSPAVEDQPQNRRLFGEIGSSALRSSGVLGHDAHQALDMPSGEGVDAGESSGLAYGSEGSQVNDEHHQQQHHRELEHQYPRTLPVPSTKSAYSLLGAEAQIKDLNMASPGSAPSPNTAPASPQTPKSRQMSPPSTHPLTGSKRPSEEPISGEEGSVAKRSRKMSRSVSITENDPRFYYRSDDPSTHNLEYASRVSGIDFVAQYKSRQSGTSQRGFAKLRRDETYLGEKTFDASQDMEAAYGNGHQESQPTTSPIKATSIKKQDTFAKPPTRLGKLTTIPGSVIDATYKLTKQVTTWGRDPNGTFAYPDAQDRRVSRSHFDIIFWKPGIERDLQEITSAGGSADSWQSMENIWAIITTRSSTFISVNDVKVERGNGDAYYYGKLHSGDVITIFEDDDQKQGNQKSDNQKPDNPKSEHQKPGDFLKFKCEFYLGMSRVARPLGQKFVVEKEVDKWQEAQSKVSSHNGENMLENQTENKSTNGASRNDPPAVGGI